VGVGVGVASPLAGAPDEGVEAGALVVLPPQEAAGKSISRVKSRARNLFMVGSFLFW
jgi:hypothetical protein